MGSRVVRVVLHHDLRRPLDDPVHAGRPHEHVVRLLLEHELTRPRQRIEGTLLERPQLVLAVPIREVREHEERQPVRGLLVEGAQDPRRIHAARVALQQRLRLVPALAPEVRVQQVHHRPQVAALLHVHLEEVAQVVQARRRGTEVALLLHRRRLRVTLDHDQPLEIRAVLPRHLLPRRLALVRPERDLPLPRPLGQEDSPPVVLHRDVSELRPAFPANVDGRTQVDVPRGQRRTHLRPPGEELRLPRLQRPLQPAVVVQVHVVRDPLRVIDALAHHYTRFRSNRGL